MSNDFGKTLDDLTRRRRHYNFVTAEARVLLPGLVARAKAIDLIAYQTNRAAVARCAVQLAEELFKALPPNPDDPPSPAAVAELDIPPLPDSHEAPVPLLPVEPEVTTRAPSLSIWDDMHEVSPAVLARASQEEPSAPTCTRTGQQPCSAACRRCVPERRQSAGPEEATHAERAPRRPVSERLARLADCKTSTDAATIAAYHAHLASSGLKDCGACGLVFDAGAPNPGRPFDASTAELEALVRYVASAPIQEDAGTEGAGVSP